MKRLRKTLLYLLPIVLFFSYHPRIPLGSTVSMNLELSLPLIWLGLFTLLSLPILPSSLQYLTHHFFRSKKLPLFLLSLFPLYLTISILWSENRLRAILTSGIVWCLWVTILTIPRIMSKKTIKNILVKIFFYTSIIISVCCWLQCILDIINIDPSLTLLCKGCTYRSFGFPHPNGFAIEPQFMGNLLLAPCFLSLYLLFSAKKAPHPNLLASFRPKHLLSCAIFLITTLFLTFSRGAIYAFLLGLSVLIILRLVQTKKPTILLSIPIVLTAFLLSLTTQGLLAQFSPTTDTFTSGVAKAINQLSLGHIALDSPSNEYHHDESTSTQESYFDGYVAESTEIRVQLTNLALDLWDDSPTTIIFGAGLGASGVNLYQKFPSLGSPKEIVQNEYVTLLLELGLVGCATLVISLVILAKYIITRLTKEERAYSAALMVAFLATLFFFSGLPNALHIYLLPVLMIG